MTRTLPICVALGLAVMVTACDRARDRSDGGGSAATATTARANEAVASAYDLTDPQSFADAGRGLVATPHGKVLGDAGEVLWDFDSFGFVAGKAPPTVNPSLWRQELLNNHVGLFKVTDRIFQLRGFDLANITLIEGQTGWIVVDALTSRQTAAFALSFARQHLGARKVSAVVFSHSHVDHFGGALGVIPAEEAAARRIPVVAPAGFMDEATSENVLMGVAMGAAPCTCMARASNALQGDWWAMDWEKPSPMVRWAFSRPPLP